MTFIFLLTAIFFYCSLPCWIESSCPFQVERLKVDVDKRGSEQQRKTKEKTVDTKRMQDLQQQVSHTDKQANASHVIHSLPLLCGSFLKSLPLFTRSRSWSRY